MGRSGGGGGGFSGGGGGFSGGGGRGGSFSGGSGGSGGRSSSHSSGGHSYSGGHSSSHSSYGGGVGPIIFFGGGHYVDHPSHQSDSSSSPTSGPSPSTGKRGAGCGTVILVCVFFFFLLSILSSITGNSSTSGSSISPSTQQREKLPASAVNLTAYYTDADGDWIHNSFTLEEGLKQFYEDTGVQPYVYILPNGQTESSSELEAFAEEQYQTLFNDDGHFLLAFCDNGYGGYNCGYWMGNQASTVMDSEALEILQNYLAYYYSDMDISEEEIFSLTFSKTGARIMTVTESQMPKMIIAFLIVTALLVIYMIIRKRKEAEAEKAKHTEEILNTPLETYAQHELDDLAAKYDTDKPAGAAPSQEAPQPAPAPAPEAAAAAQAAPQAPDPGQAPAAPAQAAPAQPAPEDEFKDPELVALEEKYKKLAEEEKAAAAQDDAQ